MSHPGWTPGGTTGDRQLDQAIARFIHNPATLRCDVQKFTVEYWRTGRTDARPQPLQPAIWKDERYKGSSPQEPGFTRGQIMDART